MTGSLSVLLDTPASVVVTVGELLLDRLATRYSSWAPQKNNCETVRDPLLDEVEDGRLATRVNLRVPRDTFES